MNETGRLSIPEFLADIRLTIVSPARRFHVIQERGALWGSLLLLIAPAYVGFHWWGAIYFDKDPFPGYSLLAPLVPAVALSLLKPLGVHVLARLFEGRGRFTAGKGKFRNLLVVFGYAGLPPLIAMVAGLLLFVTLSAQIGAALVDFHAISLSLLVAIGVGTFVWNLILMVLALRTVYALRDWKVVISLLVGPPLAALPAMSLMFMVGETKVDFAYFRPILQDRVVRFVSAQDRPEASEKPKIAAHVDLIAYRFKQPARSDLVIYLRTSPGPPPKKGGNWVLGMGVRFILKHKGEGAMGRVVGLPGERVELVEGRLLINGQEQTEPHILPQYRAAVSSPEKLLGPDEYFILPEDRTLVESLRKDLVVPRGRIAGRTLIRKWPTGWFWFRPNAF